MTQRLTLTERARIEGGLHRWLRQIGHDGRLVQSATDQWRFSGSTRLSGESGF